PLLPWPPEAGWSRDPVHRGPRYAAPRAEERRPPPWHGTGHPAGLRGGGGKSALGAEGIPRGVAAGLRGGPPETALRRHPGAPRAEPCLRPRPDVEGRVEWAGAHRGWPARPRAARVQLQDPDSRVRSRTGQAAPGRGGLGAGPGWNPQEGRPPV